MKLVLPLAIVLAVSTAFAQNWPQWRGPNQDGSSPATNLPDKFSKTEGVKWAAELPGASASVPVIWGDSVFLTTAIEAEQKLIGLCFDAATGKEKWRKVIADGLRWDERSNLASPSPVTDGERVYFFFATGDLAAFDFGGNEKWKRNLAKDHGSFATQWTYSSSPMLDQGRLYVQVLQRDEAFDFHGVQKGERGRSNDSYLLCLNPQTGRDIWKVKRPTDAVAESMEAFSTPVATTHDGQRLILLTGGDCITGHDAATGKELWRWGTWNPEKIGHWRLVPSPVAGGGVALACAPKKNPIYAVKLGRTGNLSESDLAWISDPKQASSDVSTPLFYEGRFYVLDSDRKSLSCVEPATGRVIWQGDFPSKAKIEASPTGADGKIFAINFWGEVFVARAGGSRFELLHTTDLGDGTKPSGNDRSCRASIAAANGCLFIRTQDKLYCIAR